MRYRLIALSFLAALPVMSGLHAAPVPPEPYAVLDIGPPHFGVSPDEHCKRAIGHFTFAHGIPSRVWRDSEVRKLKSIPDPKDYPLHWLANHVTVKQEGHDNCLRLTFKRGTRKEQVIILNAFLRAYIRLQRESLPSPRERMILPRDKRLDEAEERVKQICVRRWAK